MNGFVNLKKGFYDKAFDSFSEGLSLREDIGFNHLIINSLNNFGYLYLMMSDFEKAIHYYEKSIKLTKDDKQEKYKQNYGDRFALEIGTWCPINTQNTSYSREIIPASFVPPNVGRYDDIWSGYILRKITHHLNHYIS